MVKFDDLVSRLRLTDVIPSGRDQFTGRKALLLNHRGNSTCSALSKAESIQRLQLYCIAMRATKSAIQFDTDVLAVAALISLVWERGQVDSAELTKLNAAIHAGQKATRKSEVEDQPNGTHCKPSQQFRR